MVTPITATTQDHLNIADIQNNLVLLKNGAAAMVLRTSAVNFGLLSEQEQDAIIYAYAALLNSLTFPIQILIRSQKKDISQYLELLKVQQEKLTDPRHRQQIQAYRQFVESLVKEGNILDKKFYVVIPFTTLELGIGKATTSALSAIKPTKTKNLPFPKDYILQRANTALEPKRDHLIRQFNRIGFRTHQLTTQLCRHQARRRQRLHSTFSSASSYPTTFTTWRSFTWPTPGPTRRHPHCPYSAAQCPKPSTSTSVIVSPKRLSNSEI